MSDCQSRLIAGLLAGAGVFFWQFVLAADRADWPGVSPTPPERYQLGEGNLLAGIPGEGPLSLVDVRLWLRDPANHRELLPILPIGLDEGSLDIRGLDTNPLTRAKIELGRQLFFDTRLSRDGTVSCASCHMPGHGFAMPTRFGVGVDGQQGSRNSQTVANRILSERQFWDGRADSLEQQAVGPMSNPVEMGFTHEAVIDFVNRVGGYRAQFAAIFEDAATIENAGHAIAAFERTLVSGPTSWDHHRRLRDFEAAFADELDELDDDLDEELLAEHATLQAAAAEAPLSAAAERGAGLFFGDAACSQCHAGANFSDERYHNLGVGFADDGTTADWGRYEITREEADRGAFKTPGLRNVAQTAPYMHDGSLATLADVVAWYVEGGRDNPHLSSLVGPLDLDDQRQADLVAFLESLNGKWPTVEVGRLPQESSGQD